MGNFDTTARGEGVVGGVHCVFCKDVGDALRTHAYLFKAYWLRDV